MRRLVLLLSLLLLIAAARPGGQEAGQPWLMTTGDFAVKRVKLVGIGADGLRIALPDGQASQLPMQQVVRLERAGPSEPAISASFILHLRSGDRLAGRPVRLTDTALVMEAAPFGEIEVPLEELRGAWTRTLPAALA